jgi:dATP pyrophosphohydrolase
MTRTTRATKMQEYPAKIPAGKKYKIPISVLVVIHTPDLQVLLLERADHPGFWQSVTGSQDEGETLRQTAAREVAEETGLDAGVFELTDWNLRNEYEIYPEWRWRYEPGITRNVEHVFGLRLPGPLPVTVASAEHLGYVWMPHDQAADKVFSWSNAQVLKSLPERVSNRLKH